ncbi:hypothetical protein HZH68_007493 [Vespula germanica]|uniref:Uncharacterized protein n=1 Tax=Vespula germanica TaxID=30212 RepID=A0A834NBT7_VESGE|nr:hypothetical protein HZH68_007493 [Vespula germanica]
MGPSNAVECIPMESGFYGSFRVKKASASNRLENGSCSIKRQATLVDTGTSDLTRTIRIEEGIPWPPILLVLQSAM